MNYTKSNEISKSVIGEIIDISYFPKELIGINTNTEEISENMVALSMNGLVGTKDKIFPGYVKISPL